MVMHACNPNTQEAEAEGSQFETRMGYIGRSYLKTDRKPEMNTI
jgi:hypothetical protein